MGTVRTDEFRKDAVRIALTSGLSRRQVADDLGVGLSTLNKWVNAHRDTDVVSAEDRELARENERLRREIRILNTSGIAGHVYTSGEALIIHDAYADDMTLAEGIELEEEAELCRGMGFQLIQGMIADCKTEALAAKARAVMEGDAAHDAALWAKIEHVPVSAVSSLSASPGPSGSVTGRASRRHDRRRPLRCRL